MQTKLRLNKSIIVLSDDKEDSLDDYDDDFENVKEQGSEKEITSGKALQKPATNIQVFKQQNKPALPVAPPKPADAKVPLFQSKVNFEAKKQEIKQPIKKIEEKKSIQNEKKIQKEEKQGKALFITQAKNSRLEVKTNAKKAQSKPREPIQKKDLAKNNSTNLQRAGGNNRKAKLRSSVQSKVDPEAINALTEDNLNLIQQLIRLSQQVDEKMPSLRITNQSVISQSTSPNQERLKTKRELMEERAKKMKVMKKDIQNMYKILDNTYNIDEFIKKENKVKNQEKIINKQMNVLNDCKKVIKGQNRFFREANKTNEQTGHIEDIESHYIEAKTKHKELREQFRTEDKKVKDQHVMIQILKDR